jgi:transposase
MKPYSIDLRQKIIEVYENEDISIRKLAQRFRVTKSFIQKLLKQYRETGNINPQSQGGSPPSKLNSEQLMTLIEIIQANDDATLSELCTLLEEKNKIRVSRSTMGRFIQRNRSLPPKKSELKMSHSEKRRKRIN